jgi:hypothetical protein
MNAHDNDDDDGKRKRNDKEGDDEEEIETGQQKRGKIDPEEDDDDSDELETDDKEDDSSDDNSPASWLGDCDFDKHLYRTRDTARAEEVAAVAENKPSQDYANLEIDDDWYAESVGQALAKNAFLETLSLNFYSSVTASGGQALADGLRSSQIKNVDIHLTQDGGIRGSKWPSGAMHFAGEALQAVERLQIVDELTNNIAVRLGTKLEGSTSLNELIIEVGPTLTTTGAQALARGLSSSNIDSLTVGWYRAITNRDVLQKLFQGFTCARAVELSFALKDDAVQALGEALVGNTSLKALHLKIDCTLSGTGATILAKGLRGSQIEWLGLQDERALSKKVQTILFKQGIRDSQTIRRLYLNINLSVTSALATCLPILKGLEIVDKKFPTTDFVPRLSVASQLSVLKLNLFLSAQDMNRLLQLFSNLISLTKLDVRCNLTCEQGAAFIDEIGNRQDVPYATLEAKNIRAIGAERLMLAVANHPTIVDLDLSGCQDIGFIGVEMIALHLPNVKLNRLNLYPLNDEFDYRGKKEDTELVKARVWQALVAGVRTNWHLREIWYVARMFIPGDVATELDFYLHLNKRGRYLLHVEHGLPCGVWSRILATCRASVMYYHLREQPQLLVLAANVER